MAIKRVALVVGALLLAGLTFLGVRMLQCHSDRPAATVTFPLSAELSKAEFPASGKLSEAAYGRLFRYFLTGFQTYRSASGASAGYPGLPSRHGPRVDRLEGFSRFAPLAAAWLHSGRERVVRLADGRQIDLVELLVTAIRVGTDPRSPEYWGAMADLDQRIVEAADVALVLWLTRDSVWAGLSGQERSSVAAWLGQVNRHEVHDNNWHLFIVLVNAVLGQLGQPVDEQAMLEHYGRMKVFYRGGGWFSDGVGDKFDYYNAWAIHYALHWLRDIRPDWDADFIDRAQGDFLAGYKYLIGPAGFPVYGRSLCYRMAVPAPLVSGHVRHPDRVSAGEARRALDAVWGYFIRQGAVRGGGVAQGYCGPDARILDNYSGPASCLWSLRSLVAAFALPAGSAFWQSAGEALPVEVGDYRLPLGPTGWIVVGNHASRGIVLMKADGAAGSRDEPELQPYGYWRRFREWLSCTPMRPANTAAKYAASQYRSDRPFCGCAP